MLDATAGCEPLKHTSRTIACICGWYLLDRQNRYDPGNSEQGSFGIYDSVVNKLAIVLPPQSCSLGCDSTSRHSPAHVRLSISCLRHEAGYNVGCCLDC